MTDKLLAKYKSLIISVSALLGIIILQLILGYIFDGICRMITGTSFRDNGMLTVAFYAFYSLISILVFSICYKLIKKNDLQVYFRLSSARVIGLVLVSVALQGVAYGALNVIYQLASDNQVLNSYSSMIKNLNGSTTPLIFIYTMCLAPIVEEIVFRGVIFEGARQGFGVKGANIIQALCFGVFHGNIVQGIYAFALGIALGYIVSQRHCILESIGVHIFINCAGIFIIPIIASLFAEAVGALMAYIIVLILAAAGCFVWFVVQSKIKSFSEVGESIEE